MLNNCKEIKQVTIVCKLLKNFSVKDENFKKLVSDSRVDLNTLRNCAAIRLVYLNVKLIVCTARANKEPHSLIEPSLPPFYGLRAAVNPFSSNNAMNACSTALPLILKPRE